jgi:phosphatidate phosphatase APP1
MTKILILISLNVLLSFNIHAHSISIVSDLDDTIKITNSGNFRRAIWNAFFNKKAFTNMPELLEKMESYTNDLHILSASPKIINKKIRSFLKRNDINYKSLSTRGFRDFGNKFKYKYDVVNKILNQNNDSLILIGDDVEIDQDVYVELREKNSNRIDTIYIHKVKNKMLKDGVLGFYTAIDIAVMEYKKKRLTLESVISMATIFNTMPRKKMKYYFPTFAYCPTKGEEFNKINDAQLEPYITPIYEKIINYCKAR